MRLDERGCSVPLGSRGRVLSLGYTGIRQTGIRLDNEPQMERAMEVVITKKN